MDRSGENNIKVVKDSQAFYPRRVYAYFKVVSRALTRQAPVRNFASQERC